MVNGYASSPFYLFFSYSAWNPISDFFLSSLLLVGRNSLGSSRDASRPREYKELSIMSRLKASRLIWSLDRRDLLWKDGESSFLFFLSF